MKAEFLLPNRRELANEQILNGLVFALERRFPGLIEEMLRAGAGAGRISGDIDGDYRDAALTLRLKAKRAGIIE